MPGSNVSPLTGMRSSNKSPGSNNLRLYREIGPFLNRRCLIMKENNFYFIKDMFFEDFPDPNLMQNKEIIDGKRHDRPCFFAISDKKYKNLFWFIPISSRIAKYKAIHKRKVQRYGKCNTIYFAQVLGQERAFLIQNIFPITKEYIADIYIDRNTLNAVTISPLDVKKIVSNAHEVLKLHARGINIIFPDIDKIRNKLIEYNVSKNTVREHTPWNDYLVKLRHEHGRNKDNEIER